MSVRILVLASLLVACGSKDTDTDDPTPTVVGGGVAELADFGVLAVLQYSDGSAVGYACGVGEDIEQTQWLSGQDDALSGADFQVSLSGQTAEVTGPGQQWTETLADFGQGGLFEASPQGCRSGLIVFPSGSGFSSSGTFCTPSADFFQVEPVGTIVNPGDLVPVQVETADDTLFFDMVRIQ